MLIGSFLHSYVSHLPITPVLTIRIIRALPFRRHCRIYIANKQTCLQVLSLLDAYNTLHSAGSAHISSDYAKT